MPAPVASRPWWPLPIGLAILAVAGALVLARLAALPPPAPADAPTTSFSALRAHERLVRLVAGERPRPAGSSEAAAFRARVVAELRELGLEPEIHEGLVVDVSRGRVALIRNVVAVVPGQEPEGPVVLLEAHLDSVPAGPGVSDDASGVACTLEIARALLAGEPPRRPVVLLLDEGEEAGLLGARLFADEHPLATRVGAAVVLEARGTSGPSALWRLAADERGNGWLVDVARASLSLPVTSSEIAALAARLPNDTDLSMLAERRGIPGFDLAFAGDVPRYHTPRDDLRAVDLRTLQHHGSGGLELVRALASSDLGAGEPPRHVAWCDVLGLGILTWRMDGVAPWMRLGACALAVAAGLVMLRRRGALRPRVLVAGALLPLAATVVAAGAGWAVVALLQRLAGSTAAATAHPEWTAAAVGLAALAAGLAAVAWMPASWDGPSLLAGGSLLPLLAAAALTATGDAQAPPPGLLLAHLAAVILAATTAVAAWTGERPRLLRLLLLAPAAAMALPVLELGYATFVMAGTSLPIVAAVPAALLAGLLVPAAGATAARARWTCAIVILCSAAAALGAAATRPSFTPGSPRHVSAAYLLDPENGRAWWRLVADDDDPPEAAMAPDVAARFAPRLLEGWPLARQPVLAAEAPVLPLQGASLQVLSDATEGGERRLVLRVVPGAEAYELAVLMVEPAAPASSRVRVAGRDASSARPRAPLVIAGPPAEGLELEVTLPAGGPVELAAIERRAGLPDGADEPARARLPHAVPAQDGDRTVIVTRLRR